MNLDDIKQLAETDMQSVNGIILERLKSEVVLINQLGIYIIGAGGKRLRPMLAVLTAGALNYTGNQQHLLAAIVEFIHTATLLHDDVVDESELRRGRQTANELFGNQASVLVGDYLYTRAFQMMTELNNPEVMKVFADTTNIISQGEVMQLMNVNDASVDEQSYMQIINAKTAALFEATTRLSAKICGADQKLQQHMAEYGKCLGNAFQLADDALDYTADSETLGKNIGDDLAEGKPTLPLIVALQKASTEDQQMIIEAIEQGGLDKLEEIQQVIQDCGGIEYTQQQAMNQANLAKQAISDLPDSDYKQALLTLADFSISRTH
jgi:octaprenyl-diphosphate synthase